MTERWADQRLWRKRGKRATEARMATALTVVASEPAILPALPVDAPASLMTWERALDTWSLRLQSDETRATYRSAVKQFFATPHAPDLYALDLRHLDAYAGALRRRADKDTPPSQRLSPATVNVRLSALRAFLGFCRIRHWLPSDLNAEAIGDALTGLRSHVLRPYQVVESRDEFASLLDAAADETCEPLRAVALVGLGLYAGLRISELVSLDVADLASDAASCYLDVRQGKGRKDRQVPISSDVYALVLRYLDATGRAVHRATDRATPLFLSRHQRSGSGRLSVRHARRIVRSCAMRAGFDAGGKHITPHSLRHSYALRVLLGDEAAGQPGAPLPAVTKLLGHSSVAVTGRYLNHFERRDLAAYAPKIASNETEKDTGVGK